MTVSDGDRTPGTSVEETDHAGRRVPAESREGLVTEGARLGFKLVESKVAHEVNKPRRDEPAACTVASISLTTG
eukprot:scaffold6276_cov116-Isochrysis_galbana.AAC.1